MVCLFAKFSCGFFGCCFFFVVVVVVFFLFFLGGGLFSNKDITCQVISRRIRYNIFEP